MTRKDVHNIEIKRHSFLDGTIKYSARFSVKEYVFFGLIPRYVNYEMFDPHSIGGIRRLRGDGRLLRWNGTNDELMAKFKEEIDRFIQNVNSVIEVNSIRIF